MFHFRGTPHAFHYTTIKMTTFCACKNLLIKKLKRIPKSLWRLQKSFFFEGNPLQIWPWKQNVSTVVVAVMVIEVLKKLKKLVTDKYFEKEKTLNQNYLPLQEKYVTIIIVKWLVSTWHVCLTEEKEERCLRVRNYLNQI